MHPNVKLLIDLDDRLEAGDLDAYFAGYADDVMVRVAGRSSIAGIAHGKQAMMEVFGRFNERGGDMRYERHAVLADETHGVLLWRVTAARGDESFRGSETMVVHIEDGKITEAWISFEDRYEFDSYLT